MNNAAPEATEHLAWVVRFLSKNPLPPLPVHDVAKLKTKLGHLRFEEFLQSSDLASPRPDRLQIIEMYKLWIEVNSGKSPLLFAAWFNLGVELSASGDTGNAATAYKNAMAIKADFYQASVNYGLMLENRGQPEDALNTWKAALQGDEARTILLNHRGRLQENLKQLDDAERTLRTSLLTVPMQPDAIHHWVHLRQKLCKWPLFGHDLPDLTKDEIIAHAGPLAALALFDDVDVLCKITEDWLTRKIPMAPAHLSPPEGYRHDKIRIGYMSSDYCMHAMSYLIAELIESHDRSKFEVYGYCSTKEDNSAIRKRVISAFDHYVPVLHLSEEELAKVIRNDEIDILIDLNGMTLGARLHTLRWKPAPVQLTYLGYIGPIPLPELDYILCDRYVIPEDMAHKYRPKPLYLPDVYQANDTKVTGVPDVTRAEFGLPEDKFVFCNFSNHYKITEEMFTARMDIMRQAPHSVLWLTNDNEWSARNLRARAESLGVSGDRLLFADRVDHLRYLARMRLADIFLDTFPYNAGTIASDTLRMGLPNVTLSGQSFSSRMAGSLMNGMGLTEGIATTFADYIEKAVGFANDSARFQDYRGKLQGDRWRQTIGNIERFTSQLEAAYQSIVKRPA